MEKAEKRKKAQERKTCDAQAVIYKSVAWLAPACQKVSSIETGAQGGKPGRREMRASFTLVKHMQLLPAGRHPVFQAGKTGRICSANHASYSAQAVGGQRGAWKPPTRRKGRYRIVQPFLSL